MKKYLMVLAASGICLLGISAVLLRGLPAKGPAFRTVHLFNFGSEQEEKRLLAVLGEFNQLFAKMGHPNIRYRLWRVQGQQAGEFAYLHESTWPDLATYDSVHKDAAYVKLLDKHLPFLRQVLKNEVYNRYLEIGP